MTPRAKAQRTAPAYVNWGRWVVDCPDPGCTDAREVNPLQLEDVCVQGHPFRILMPAERDASAIVEELGRRDLEQDRAWYPAGHVRAELAGQPTGQSVEQLREETAEVTRTRAKQRADRKQRLAAMLAEHGVQVGADGHFEGTI
jgi:hypothetical protein